MNLEKYKKRLQGSNSREGKMISTASHVNDIFSKTMSYKEDVIHNKEVKDAIINNTKKFDEKDILLRPYNTINRGDLIEYKDEVYLVIEAVQNEIYPKGKAKICNHLLSWLDGKNVLKEHAYLSGSYYEQDLRQNNRERNNIPTSVNTLIATLPYNENTKTIKPNQRFIIEEMSFEVKYIDIHTKVYKGKGLIHIELQFVSLSDNDDIINKIPKEENSSGWGSW